MGISYHLKGMSRNPRWPARPALFVTAALLLSSCGGSSTGDQKYTMVTLPSGKEIKAETVYRDLEITRGLMFRESLPKDQGMLFLHPQTGRHAYWTYNCRFPVDIVWMDTQHRVVEVYPNAPPCTGKSARECPTYGGRHDARYVLEMNANLANANGIREGSVLNF
jgi:uncharacterized membrane protein (UPF0127 family)